MRPGPCLLLLWVLLAQTLGTVQASLFGAGVHRGARSRFRTGGGGGGASFASRLGGGAAAGQLSPGLRRMLQTQTQFVTPPNIAAILDTYRLAPSSPSSSSPTSSNSSADPTASQQQQQPTTRTSSNFFSLQQQGLQGLNTSAVALANAQASLDASTLVLVATALSEAVTLLGTVAGGLGVASGGLFLFVAVYNGLSARAQLLLGEYAFGETLEAQIYNEIQSSDKLGDLAKYIKQVNLLKQELQTGQLSAEVQGHLDQIATVAAVVQQAANAASPT